MLLLMASTPLSTTASPRESRCPVGILRVTREPQAVALGTGGVLVARGARDLRGCCDSYTAIRKAPLDTEGISPEQLTAPLGKVVARIAVWHRGPCFTLTT